MYAEMTARIMSDYSMELGCVIKNTRPNYLAHLENLMYASTKFDIDVIRPQFEYHNKFTIQPRIDSSFMREAVHRFDKWYFRRLGIHKIKKYLWYDSNSELPGTGVKSLKELCVKQLSWSHYCLGRRYGFYSWLNTNENFTDEDIFNNYHEFSHDNSTRGEGYYLARRHLSRALDLSYTHLLKTQRHFGTLKFDYNPMRCVMEMNLMASSGIRPGPSDTHVVGEHKVTVTAIGKKIEQLPAAMYAHRNWVRDLSRGNMRHLPSHCVIKIKVERKCGYARTPAGLAKLPHKKREFFMTNTLHQLNSTWINGARIKLERGNVINVGRIWWNGGAYEFAKLLNYDVPKMNWYEGDYRAHDKHIVDYLLMVYQATNMAYFDFDKMTPAEREMFVYANMDTMFNMVVKPTCHTGDVWRILSGYLYSGGKETSHAGSFCTMLCFMIFICIQMENYPAVAAQILRCLELGFIMIAIYGDDHLWCAPRKFVGILDEVTFARVSREVFGMEITEIMHHERFLSVPDERTGEFLYVGPKFLKRHFIASDICPVVAYKSASETFANYWLPQVICRWTLYYEL